MYAPHTVTLYNVFVDVDQNTLEEVERTYTTILHGVFLDEAKGVNVRASGLESADGATLYIPFNVRATDGVTGATKRFVPPLEFIKAENKTRVWTLDAGRNTYFIKGVVVSGNETPMHAQISHDGVWSVTKVDAKDFGSLSMRHWEVGGK